MNSTCCCSRFALQLSRFSRFGFARHRNANQEILRGLGSLSNIRDFGSSEGGGYSCGRLPDSLQRRDGGLFGMFQRRNTYVFRRIRPLPVANEAEFEFQRHPDEKQEYQVYAGINEGDDEEAIPLTEAGPTIDVILTGYLEEHGNRGDRVDLETRFGREMILLKRAVYASPDNLALFKEEMEERAEELKRMPPMSPFAMKSARVINRNVFSVGMNLDVEWTMKPWHVRVAMRNAGLIVPEEAIVLSPTAISGPDISQENKLFRFYVVMNRQIIVPALGRIQLVTQDEARQVVSTVADPQTTNSQEMAQNGLFPQSIYIHDSLTDNVDVWKLMMDKPNSPTDK